MADQPNAGQGAPMQVRVLGQYVKDLSFESPSITKLLDGAPENPNLNLELNVEPTLIRPDVHEVALVFKAEAKSATGIIYDLEMVYAGLLEIKNAPPEALEPMLNINAPALLFPYLRRIVSDLTREGGFPPLMLDPVDFASLYMKKREARATIPRNKMS